MMGAPLKDFLQNRHVDVWNWDRLVDVGHVAQQVANKNGALGNVPLHCDVDTVRAG